MLKLELELKQELEEGLARDQAGAISGARVRARAEDGVGAGA